MKKLLVIFLLALTGSTAFAQNSISDAICQSNAQIMQSVIIPWRQSGQIPIGSAEETWNSESDVRLRIFLKRITRQIYANPQAGQKYIQSGQFQADCVKTHRGY
jgi:hypothetical protein